MKIAQGFLPSLEGMPTTRAHGPAKSVVRPTAGARGRAPAPSLLGRPVRMQAKVVGGTRVKGKSWKEIRPPRALFREVESFSTLSRRKVAVATAVAP